VTRRRQRLLLLGLCAGLLTGCTGVQNALDVSGAHAQEIHRLWTAMLWVCGMMYGLVIIFLAIAVLRARRPREPGAAPGTSDGARPAINRAFFVWTAMVTAGLLGLSAVSFAVDRGLFHLKGEHLQIEVTGQQWWWNVKYEEADDPSTIFFTANEMHLPVNETVHVRLRATDVIHSLWIPNLNGKQDLIPGRDTDIYLKPTKTGTFRGQCAEFCGAQHAHMAIYTIVESRERFDKWRAAQQQQAAEPGEPLASEGRNVFVNSACPLCHTIQGTDAAGISGPDLTHLASRGWLAGGTLPYSKGNLAAWIADPQTPKPGNHMPRVPLDGASLNALVTYLDGLK
jgi:cytochrome c oxidase subunit 2